MESNQGNNGRLLLLIIITSVFLFIFGSGVSFLRNPLSYLYSDVHYSLVDSGKSLKEYFGLFSDISAVKNENEKLKSENIKLKSSLDSVYSIVQENEQFRKMSRFSIKEENYVTVKMFKSTTLEEGILDKGSEEGIRVGSVVQFGEYYVGFVEKVERNGGLVKLPHSRSSFIKVSIIKPLVTDNLLEKIIAKQVETKVKSKGVLVGKGSNLVVENITMDSGVVDGDLVIVTDEKIGKFLIVGYIKNLKNDPASSSITAEVELAVNFDNLNTYFIAVDE